MPIVAIAAASFEILGVAIFVTLAVFAAWYIGAGVGMALANVVENVPAIGGSLANGIRSHITDFQNGIYNQLRGWYEATVQPLWDMMTETANTLRINAWENYNAQSETVHAIGFVYGNTVGAPTTQTQPAVTATITVAVEKLEAEIVTAEQRAVQNSEAYTYTIGQWAYAGFLSDEAAIGHVIDSVTQERAARAQAIAQTEQLAVTIAGQAAGAALTEAQREVQQASDLSQQRIEYVQSSLAGAIQDTAQTAAADTATLRNNTNAFEAGIAGLLTAHVLPAVEEIEKVGTECLDTLCGGQNAVKGLLGTLLGIAGEGMLFAMLAEAIEHPSAAAGPIAEGIGALESMPLNLYDTITRQHL